MKLTDNIGAGSGGICKDVTPGLLPNNDGVSDGWEDLIDPTDV